MRALPFALSALAVLSFGWTVNAAPRDVRDYLDRAGAAAAKRVAKASIDVGPGLDVKGRVNSDGSLSGIRVAKSSGSLETDRQAVAALKRLRVPAPPHALLGADVTVAIAKEPLLQAAQNP